MTDSGLSDVMNYLVPIMRARGSGISQSHTLTERCAVYNKRIIDHAFLLIKPQITGEFDLIVERPVKVKATCSNPVVPASYAEPLRISGIFLSKGSKWLYSRAGYVTLLLSSYQILGQSENRVNG